MFLTSQSLQCEGYPCRVAQVHASDMATKNYLAENNSDGKGLQDRLTALGISTTAQQELGRGEPPALYQTSAL
jgi:uncharacterized protein YkwD